MKVLANDGISDAGIQILESAGIELFNLKVAQEQLSNFINTNNIDVILVRSSTKVRAELIDACPSLKIIGRGGVGMDNIDVKYAERKGVKVINTPLASSRSVAEMVFAHFLSLARFLHESNRMMPLEGDINFNQLKKSYANGIELKGKILGIIGFGNIGKEIAKIGISLGMNIKALTHNAMTEVITLDFFDGQSINFQITPTENFSEFIQDVDFLTINTPKTDGYVISSKELEQMKNGIFIANTARGGVIDEVALLEALDDGKVSGAALDVFEEEPSPSLSLLMNPLLSLSPHLAGSTMEAQERIGTELASQIVELKDQI